MKTGSLRITCQIRSLLHECNTALANPNNHFTEVFTFNEQRLFSVNMKSIQHKLHLESKTWFSLFLVVKENYGRVREIDSAC